MAQSHARIDEEGGVITVTITREAKRNAISPEVTAALWEAARALANRDDLRCMVITAVGSHFTAGIDLKAGAGLDRGDPETRHQHPGWNLRRNYRDHHLLYDEFEAIEKPVVLAAQGTCLGAGVEMAVSCDFRFCTPEAEWRLPEVDLGVIPGSGGIGRLTRIIGPAWAKYMAAAGMPVSAEQAKSIGLVHDIFPAENFMADVRAFCRRLCQIPPEAFGVAKLTVDLAADIGERAVQRNIERLANTPLLLSSEYRNRRAPHKDGNDSK